MHGRARMVISIIGDDMFNRSFDAAQQNTRIAVRYVRTDLKITLHITSFLGVSKEIPANLTDISSKGIGIECNKKLSINKKLFIRLVFEDNKSFVISAKTVYQATNKKQYGLKFDKLNNELAEYLLDSQKELKIKI